MVWCGVVWCGVVSCGVVWCGVVWCGVVWCGVVWCMVEMRREFSGINCYIVSLLYTYIFVCLCYFQCYSYISVYKHYEGPGLRGQPD